MSSLLLQAAILVLVPLLLAGQLLRRLTRRSGLTAGGLWVFAHLAAGALVFGLAWVVLIWLQVAQGLVPPGLPAMVFHIAFVEAAKLLALFLLSLSLAPLECGCPDDDEPVATPARASRAPSWNPFITAPPEPWHAPTAAWTVGGFLVGCCYALLENYSVAGADLRLLLLRQAGPLILHGASAALLAWSLARFRAGHRLHPLRAWLGALALQLAYNLMVEGGFPWLWLSWGLVFPAYILLWHYAGNTKPIRPVRKKKSNPPC